MEQKRFGVKNSLIEELRLFHLALQQKRLKMPFTIRAEVFAGEEYSYETITASPRKITIPDCIPPIDKPSASEATITINK
jgi:hypothetical protein